MPLDAELLIHMASGSASVPRIDQIFCKHLGHVGLFTFSVKKSIASFNVGFAVIMPPLPADTPTSSGLNVLLSHGQLQENGWRRCQAPRAMCAHKGPGLRPGGAFGAGEADR